MATVRFTKALGLFGRARVTGAAQVDGNATVGGDVAITGSLSFTNLGNQTFAEGAVLTVGTGTGLKVGQSASKLGFFGATPAARSAAYTQTYATASRTHSNPTASSVATTAATSTTPFGYAQAQADAIVAAVNALIVDVANVKQVLNSVVDDGQTYGLLQ